MRLDLYLAEKGHSVSRAKAQAMIKDGSVRVNGVTVSKASFEVSEGDGVSVVPNDVQKYVSRGGLKLEAALKTFGVSPHGLVALDVGASSGGFTDCLLQHGAKYVYAVDSGTGQLHPALLADARVCSMENRNARYLAAEDFKKPIQLAVMDVSFISQTLLLPMLHAVLTTGALLVTLIKPQFEVGRAYLGKNGVVKDKKVRQKALESVLHAAEEVGFEVVDRMESPITGGDGNVEYLALLRRLDR